MKITHIHCVLVPPQKNVEITSELIGSNINLKGDVFELIKKVFVEAPRECNIPIVFTSQDQDNPIREEIIAVAEHKELSMSQRLFSRLAAVTTHVSGSSLCFTVIGELQQTPTVMLARFPATEGIWTQVKSDSLEVEFLNNVFLRSGRAYKAALYQDECIETGFWDGRAVDKQASDSSREISEYWIQGFLQSQFRLTAKRGTLLLCKALRKAMDSKEDIRVKNEIMAVGLLLVNRAGRRASFKQICGEISISQEAKELLRKSYENQTLYDEPFEFSLTEYTKQDVFKSVYLDHGGILTALNSTFDQCFQSETVAEHKIRFSTEGQVVDIKMKRRV